MKKIIIKKPTKKSINANVAPEKSFWFCDGQVAKNLRELVSILEKMPPNVFDYHVNNNKNDFSRWVADVFGQATLSKEIQKIKSAATMAKKIKVKL